MDNLIEYLKEYEILCKKYQLYIGACGCCDSPFVIENEEICFGLTPEQTLQENIDHLKKA